MKHGEAVDVSGFARLLGLEQPLTAEEIGALYVFIGEHYALHDIVVMLHDGVNSLEPAFLERVCVASGLTPEVFQGTLITLIRAFVFTPHVEPSATPKPAVREPEAVEAAAKPKRKYRRKGQAKAKSTRKRRDTMSVGEKVPLPDKLRTLIAAEKKRGEKPKQTLQRVLEEHPGPRGFCEFANPILRQAGIRGFSPGQFHELARFDFRGWRS